MRLFIILGFLFQNFAFASPENLCEDEFKSAAKVIDIKSPQALYVDVKGTIYNSFDRLKSSEAYKRYLDINARHELQKKYEQKMDQINTKSEYNSKATASPELTALNNEIAVLKEIQNLMRPMDESKSADFNPLKSQTDMSKRERAFFQKTQELTKKIKERDALQAKTVSKWPDSVNGNVEEAAKIAKQIQALDEKIKFSTNEPSGFATIIFNGTDGADMEKRIRSEISKKEIIAMIKQDELKERGSTIGLSLSENKKIEADLKSVESDLKDVRSLRSDVLIFTRGGNTSETIMRSRSEGEMQQAVAFSNQCSFVSEKFEHIQQCFKSSTESKKMTGYKADDDEKMVAAQRCENVQKLKKISGVNNPSRKAKETDSINAVGSEN